MIEKRYSFETASKDANKLMKKIGCHYHFAGLELLNRNAGDLRLYFFNSSFLSLSALKQIAEFYGDDDPYIHFQGYSSYVIVDNKLRCNPEPKGGKDGN